MNIRECLECKIEIKGKSKTAKFCSGKCRVAYHRKNSSQRPISQFQLQGLYKQIVAALDESMGLNKKESNMEFKAPSTSVYNGPRIDKHLSDEPSQILTSYISPERLMMKYTDERRNLTCNEEFKDWLIRLSEDERLSKRQRETVKNTI